MDSPPDFSLTMCLCCVPVQYKLSEDPKLLTTGKVPSRGETCISLAPDSRVVAVAVVSSIFLYSTASGDLLETLDNVHKGWRISCRMHFVTSKEFYCNQIPACLA